MLRVSAETSETDINLQLVNGASSDNSAVEHSNELMAFATAVAARDEAALAVSRKRLLTVSNPEVLVDAAAIAGNFQRMVRIADAIGIPMDADDASTVKATVDELDLRRFKTAENSPQ